VPTEGITEAMTIITIFIGYLLKQKEWGTLVEIAASPYKNENFCINITFLS
jgi:hypothetical protein